MAIMLAVVLGLLALAFVLYPLYQRKHEDTAVAVPSRVTVTQKTQGAAIEEDSLSTSLEEKEQSARSSLREVELDYQLGNIAEPEYQDLRARYMQQALVALRSRYEREQEIDTEIEEQLSRMKEEYEKADK